MGRRGVDGRRGISRRRFLVEMGAVGGAGAVLSSMEVLGLVPPAAATKVAYRAPRRSDFSLQGRPNDTSVVVLGAGVAGLCTAYELEKAGYDVTVLEARERPGGRVWTARNGTVETSLDGHRQRCRFDEGQYMNVGAARIPQHHTTLEYCRELGVAIEVFTNANAQGWYYNEADDRVGGALAGERVRHRKAKADAYGYVSELLSKAVSQGALDAELTPADKEAMIEFLRSFGFLSFSTNTYEGGGWTTGYPRDDEPGAGTQYGTPLEPAALSDVLASRLGEYFSFEREWDQAMVMYQAVGGMDRLPHAFEAALDRPPAYGAVVTDIAHGTDDVTVTYTRRGRTRQVTADWCVCTIPPQILLRIPNDFGAQVNADLAVPVPLAVGKIGLQFGRRWWEEDEDLYGGITNTNLDIGTIWYPSHGYLGRKGVVIGYYNAGEQADQYAALTPAEREARALELGSRIHGDVYRSAFETSFSNSWSTTRYSEGGWAYWTFEDGGAAYDRLLQPAGRTWFAGDHLSNTTAWQHGALESARLTVSSLHQRVLTAS